MKYATIDKINFGCGVTAVLPKKIWIRRGTDATLQYEAIIYALLKHINGVKFKKPTKQSKILDYVTKHITSPEYKVDERGHWYVEHNGEKVYV